MFQSDEGSLQKKRGAITVIKEDVLQREPEGDKEDFLKPSVDLWLWKCGEASSGCVSNCSHLIQRIPDG